MRKKRDIILIIQNPTGKTMQKRVRAGYRIVGFTSGYVLLQYNSLYGLWWRLKKRMWSIKGGDSPKKK